MVNLFVYNFKMKTNLFNFSPISFQASFLTLNFQNGASGLTYPKQSEVQAE